MRTRATCPDCGNPIEKCSDPDKVWYPYRRICWATLERESSIAKMKAVRGEKANFHDGTFTSWRETWSPSHPCPAGTAETVGVAETDLTPWDEFTTKADASPLSPSDVAVDDGVEVDGEHDA